MITNRIGGRVTAALAVVACCLFLVVGATLVASSADDRTSTGEIDGAEAAASNDRALDAAAPGDRSARRAVDERRIDGSAVQATAPTGSTQSQLFGVLLVLVVLALVGAAAWGVRPAALDRFGRATNLGRRSHDGDGPDSGTTEEELLTDEERIVSLLEKNGGRLKQQHVVETTDWSKAKVSRLLSSMEDDDTIVRIQLGREKLIFLSGHEPSGVRSTLGEDR